MGEYMIKKYNINIEIKKSKIEENKKELTFENFEKEWEEITNKIFLPMWLIYLLLFIIIAIFIILFCFKTNIGYSISIIIIFIAYYLLENIYTNEIKKDN